MFTYMEELLKRQSCVDELSSTTRRVCSFSRQNLIDSLFSILSMKQFKYWYIMRSRSNRSPKTLYNLFVDFLNMCGAHASDLLRPESCQIMSNPVSSLSVCVYTQSSLPLPGVFFWDVIGWHWVPPCGLPLMFTFCRQMFSMESKNISWPGVHALCTWA